MENYQQDQSNLNIPQGPPPDNYLVWAILCTLFCCLPLGIVSIIKSSQVNTKWQVGDYEGARLASEEAKKYAKLGAIIGVAVIVLYMIAVFVLGFGGALLGRG